MTAQQQRDSHGRAVMACAVHLFWRGRGGFMSTGSAPPAAVFLIKFRCLVWVQSCGTMATNLASGHFRWRARVSPRLWHSGGDLGATRIPERRGDRLEPVPSTPQTQRHHSDDTHSTETRQLLHAVQSAKASASSLESSLGSAATWSRAQNEVLLFAARARRTARSRRRRPKE